MGKFNFGALLPSLTRSSLPGITTAPMLVATDAPTPSTQNTLTPLTSPWTVPTTVTAPLPTISPMMLQRPSAIPGVMMQAPTAPMYLPPPQVQLTPSFTAPLQVPMTLPFDPGVNRLQPVAQNIPTDAGRSEVFGELARISGRVAGVENSIRELARAVSEAMNMAVSSGDLAQRLNAAVETELTKADKAMRMQADAIAELQRGVIETFTPREAIALKPYRVRRRELPIWPTNRSVQADSPDAMPADLATRRANTTISRYGYGRYGDEAEYQDNDDD